MEINSKAFSILQSAPNPPPWNGAKNPIKWYESVTETSCSSSALLRAGSNEMDRQQLAEFCGEVDVAAEDIFFAVCAWGGMRVNNGRLAWSCAEKWATVIDNLKVNCLNRRGAYRLFADLRAKSSLPGMGPAFFTKIIFFVRPDLNGYIMDQWTARSINLLYGNTIQLTRNPSVAPNNPDIYEDFCNKIEDLSVRLRRTPAEAERAIFSIGGRHPGCWRSYVKSHGGGIEPE